MCLSPLWEQAVTVAAGDMPRNNTPLYPYSCGMYYQNSRLDVFQSHHLHSETKPFHELVSVPELGMAAGRHLREKLKTVFLPLYPCCYLQVKLKI